MMKRRVFKITISVGAFLLLLGSTAYIVDRSLFVRSTGLSFERIIFEAEAVKQADKRTIRHHFAFRNTSSESIKVSKIQTSCGCTVASLTKQVFGPGESGDVDATMILPSFGRKAVDVFVFYDDGAAPSRLQLIGTFLPEAQVSWIPAKPELLGTRSTAVCELTLEILSEVEGKAQIQSVTAKSGQAIATIVNTEVHPLASTLGYYRTTFKINIRPAPSSGDEWNDILDIRMSAPEAKTFVVPIKGKLLADWTPVPSRVIFVSSASGVSPARLNVAITGTSRASVSRIDNPFSSWLNVGATSSVRGIELFLLPQSANLPTERLDGAMDIVIVGRDGSSGKVNVPLCFWPVK